MILDAKKTNFDTSPDDFNAEVSFNRKNIEYSDLSSRFVIRESNFERQHSVTFAARLGIMRGMIEKQCFVKWGTNVPVLKLHEVVEAMKKKCILIGTVFKEMPFLPNVLKEMAEEMQLMPQPKLNNFVSTTDKLVLEDEVQRIILRGNINMNQLATGVVIGVIGGQYEEGYFDVEDVCFAGWTPSYVDIPVEPTKEEDRYILIVSGLEVGTTQDMLPLQLLADFITGELGSILDQEKHSRICRVVIAGNSIRKSNHISMPFNYFPVENYADSTVNVKTLDDLLVELARCVDVDIMPGEHDPSNYIMPQQSMLKFMFPKSAQYQSFHCVPNPYECVVERCRILGSAGQPVNDIKTVTELPNNVSVLEHSLMWGHMAPTAGDTLGSSSFTEEDPYIITEQPDIYFAGNVSDYETKLITINGKPVRLLGLPAFGKTQSCALINLRTLDCSPLVFKIFQN